MQLSHRLNKLYFRAKTFVPFLGNYPKPKTVFWWFEAICNLRCNHCDIGKKTLLAKFRPALDINQKRQVIEVLSAWFGKSFSLSFIAGEPFLHQDMYEVLACASKYNVVTSLTSNGTIVSIPKNAGKVVLSGLNFLALSLDSYNPTIHDKSRGRQGVRNQVMAAVKYLKQAKTQLKRDNPKIFINSIIMKNNTDELIDLIKWVKREQLDGITFQPIASTEFFAGDPAGKFWFKKSPLWPTFDQALKFVDKLEKMKKSGFPIQNSQNDFKRFRGYFTDPVKFSQTETCEAELNSILITHDGYVKMCPSGPEYFGHILKDNLDVIWNSAAASKARKHVYECQTQAKILAINKEDFYFSPV